MIICLKAPVVVVQSLFIFTAATGPTAGVMFGGWIIDNNGGYKGVVQRYFALKTCLALGR